MTFTSSIQSWGVTVRFPEKPPEHIRAMMKAHGFRWSAGAWFRRRVNGAADFLAALEQAGEPKKPVGACWKCQDPAGFFRPCGAATPVYCDACWQALRQPDQRYVQPDPVDLAYEDDCARACGL